MITLSVIMMAVLLATVFPLVLLWASHEHLSNIQRCLGVGLISLLPVLYVTIGRPVDLMHYHHLQSLKHTVLTHLNQALQSQNPNRDQQLWEDLDRLKTSFTYPEAYQHLADIYFQLKQPDRAQHLLTKGLTQFPDSAALMTLWTQAVFEKEGGMPSKQEHHRIMEAIYQYRQQQPNHPALLNLSAMLAFQSQQYEQAIDTWQHLVDVIPTQSPLRDKLHQTMAQAEYRLNRPEAEKLILPQEVRSACQNHHTAWLWITLVQPHQMPDAVIKLACEDVVDLEHIYLGRVHYLMPFQARPNELSAHIGEHPTDKQQQYRLTRQLDQWTWKER